VVFHKWLVLLRGFFLSLKQLLIDLAEGRAVEKGVLVKGLALGGLFLLLVEAVGDEGDCVLGSLVCSEA